MPGVNYGLCDHCGGRVPAGHVTRDGKAYLTKDCPDCGRTESLISSFADRWQHKRDIYHYDPDEVLSCSLDCAACGKDHHPRIVFVDVTNRCNLDCPICLANVPGMGFVFNPPLDYFEKIFDALGSWDPKPRIELFGGEPTVREDLFEIIETARARKLPVSVVTNSIRLANEEYCKKICEAKVDLLLAFDGRDPEVYQRMRGSTSAYDKKLKALDNVKRYSKRRHTVVCTLARGLNDHVMKDHFEFLHGYRSIIRRLFFIPLAELWDEDNYEAKVRTTPEDVEEILDDAFGEEKLEFVPIGLFGFIEAAYAFFGKSRVRFSTVHPNCESGAFLVSDGERYHPISVFLKRPLADVASDFVLRAQKINPRLAKLDPKKRLDRLRGKLLAVRAFAPLLFGALDFKKVMIGSRLLGTLRILGGAMLGKSFSDLVRKHTHIKDTVDITILPFEEPHSLESARLERCSAAFAYVDPDTNAVGTIPFCTWCLYRKQIFRKIADRYAREGARATS
jgi:uncharacterized radical SAM superfamily Fe-S cluster-containing enzyme